MLDFERRVAATVMTTWDAAVRADVEAFVAGSLADMPEYLRVGVFVQSVAFSFWSRVPGGHDPAALVRRLEASRIPLLRQYVRLFRSLVLFAEQEFAGQQA